MTGWTYNTPDDVPTDGPRITAVCLTFTIIALLLVCLRWYVRTTLVKAVGYDDWVIIVSWLGACGYTVCSVIQTKWGLGITRLEDMPPQNVLPFGKLQFIGGPFYVLGIWGFKMSLLFSYLRFFPAGGYKIGTIIVAVACTMGHIAFMCVFIFLCTPIEKQYDPSIPANEGHCVDAITFYLTFSSLTIVFDVIIMFLPFPVILNSQIQNRKKIVLLALFILGIFVTIIQAIRIQTIKNLVNYLDSAKSIQWSVVETCIGIIISCVPTLAPMVKYFAERSRNAGSTTGGGGGASRPKSSKYALQTWGTKRSGMQPLGTGVDNRDADGTSVSGGSLTTKPEDSTENILDPGGVVSKGRTLHAATPSEPESWTDPTDKERKQDV
ncbi:integral membrane protein [Colletotrichum simmondsii]|uniref:Integral membrane protein n=1 Tax=Colletotrichum simmondsii TaxID=703756 RepID=A0A135TMG2_9PEZI|nr:integral membrane protein [Colletotrichum simmondsii]